MQQGDFGHMTTWLCKTCQGIMTIVELQLPLCCMGAGEVVAWLNVAEWGLVESTWVPLVHFLF